MRAPALLSLAFLVVAQLSRCARTVQDCATNLNCSLLEIEELTETRQRRELVLKMQKIHGPALGASDRWNNIVGVMDFFLANDLGNEPNSWWAVTDCVILEGIEHGLAIALGKSSHSSNPSAKLWSKYASNIRRWNLSVESDRGEHDRAWAEAEFAGTEYGRFVAEKERGIAITDQELRWVAFTQLYRFLMVAHNGLVLDASEFLDVMLSGSDHKGFLDWVTDVRLRAPARTGLQVAWEMSEAHLMKSAEDGIKVMEAYLPYLVEAYNQYATTRVVREAHANGKDGREKGDRIFDEL